MRLSLCIPVYNQNVTNLVEELVLQLDDQKFRSEILVYDDGSSNRSVCEHNRRLNDLPGVHYREMALNRGRAAIRNRLAEDAQGSHLIFLDDDSLIEEGHFIASYARQKAYPVVCGGRVYPDSPPSTDQKLHWLYGSKVESKSAHLRNREGGQAFHSNNFMIQKPVFQQFGFDENIIQYGHEDTLFGFELRRSHIEIQHIDNPVLHSRLESNEEFLAKSRRAIENLAALYQRQPAGFQDYVRLLRMFQRMKDLKMERFMARQFRNRQAKWERNLLSEQPSLRVFNWYKLCYLCSLTESR